MPPPIKKNGRAPGREDLQVSEKRPEITNLRYAMAMSRTATSNVRKARNIVALQRTARRHSTLRAELDPVIADLREDLDETMSKSQAAQLIGVSVPTLDKWVDRRIVPVLKAPSGRPRIPRDTALDLAERIGDLRDGGQKRNLIVGVVEMLQRKDATYQREFQTLYGPGLAALAEGDLVSAAPPRTFGPED